MLDDDLKRLAKELLACYEEEYKSCEYKVRQIINSGIKNIDYIEHTLDQALDIYTEKGFNLFMKLLLYYRTVNKDNANEYLEILKNQRKEEYNEYVKKLGSK